MVKSIHFILPAGGVRGSFQAGFLYELFTKHRDSFEIYKIDGTSVGSINGIATLLGQYEVLKNTWLTIKDINDFFGNWCKTPLISKISNLYYGFYNSGIYNNTVLKDKLIENLKSCKESSQSNLLEKYSCVVTNVSEAKAEYITATNEQIFDYITASASPWVIANPITINDKIYTDGGVLETYPTKNITNSGADMVIIVGFDQEIVKFEEPNCSNILFFLAALLDIARFNSINSKTIIDFIKEGHCLPITNPMTCLFTDFTPEVIHTGFAQGQDAAEQFYRTYLQNRLEYEPIKIPERND